MDNKSTQIWQIVIFMIDNKANHCALSIPNMGMADLSLLGARIIPWDQGAMPKGDRVFYDIEISNTDATFSFLSQPGELAWPIRKEEKKFRGWHLTEMAPDFVRTFHTQRSLNPDDMNCVEWIVRALELGEVRGFSDQVLTPTELQQWCETNLIKTDRRL